MLSNQLNIHTLSILRKEEAEEVTAGLKRNITNGLKRNITNGLKRNITNGLKRNITNGLVSPRSMDRL